MNPLIICAPLAVIAFLASCTTHPTPESQNRKATLPRQTVFREHALQLDLTLGTQLEPTYEKRVTDQYGSRNATTSRYTLKDLKSGAVLAEAESAIVISNNYEGKFHGTQTIEISDDGQKILIFEDVSDASPSARYILFQKNIRGPFDVFYLAPPYVKLPPGPGEFDYMLPEISLKDAGFERIPRFKTPFNR